MKSMKLRKAIISTLVAVLVAIPITASAEWSSNNKGWWYTEGNSYAIGWKKIDGYWYYFYQNGYMAQNTTIDGYYLSSNGVCIDSVNTLIGQEILKNISIQNPSFCIKCPSSEVNINNLENIIEDQINNKLKITNSYEVFNIDNYKVTMTSDGLETINIKFDVTYRMTAEMEADLDEKARAIVSSIAPDGMSQSEKELAIHDWIVNNTQYDQSLTIYDPYNTLIKHTGVCEGYSLLAQKMFTIAGIKSIVVEGKADGEDHAWNLVYIDGKWRHVDCTWDDPVSIYGDTIQYDYYNLTDEEMSEDHSWDTSLYPNAN